MRLGMFMMSLHDPARDNHEVLLEDVEIAAYCDELGFDEFWIGEHYTASSEPVPAPMIFIANLLARTKHMKLGTGVVNLPQCHPGAGSGSHRLPRPHQQRPPAVRHRPWRPGQRP